MPPVHGLNSVCGDGLGLASAVPACPCLLWSVMPVLGGRVGGGWLRCGATAAAPRCRQSLIIRTGVSRQVVRDRRGSGCLRTISTPVRPTPAPVHGVWVCVGRGHMSLAVLRLPAAVHGVCGAACPAVPPLHTHTSSQPHPTDPSPPPPCPMQSQTRATVHNCPKRIPPIPQIPAQTPPTTLRPAPTPSRDLPRHPPQTHIQPPAPE